MDIQLNITGGSYTHKSLPISAQVTRNFWPQLIENPFAKSKYVLESWLGQKSFGSATGKSRGIFAHKGVLYRVVGETLYSVNSSGSHTSLGTIPGTNRCIFDAIVDSVVIVTHNNAYVWNGTSLAEVTDSDYEGGNSCTTINNQVVYDGNGARFGVSNVGDPSSINGLNYATAETKPDDLVRVYAFDQILYLLGTETVEQWWNSGSGNPPFTRIEGGIVQVGLAALHSVSNNDNFIYFLGDDKKVYRMRGSVIEPVLNSALARTFEKYNTIDDAIGWCMTINGQNFYVLTFPTEDKTWVYPENGQWFEWSTGVNGGRNRANGYAFVFNKHIVEDYENGNLYELDFDTYTETGSLIRRVRDTAPLHGGLFGAAGKMLTMNSLEIFIETGVGLSTGQGSDPEIMISFSDDGGRSWSTEMFGKIGKLGEYQWQVSFNNLGSFYNRVIRLSTSDPVYYSVQDAVSNIEIGI